MAPLQEGPALPRDVEIRRKRPEQDLVDHEERAERVLQIMGHDGQELPSRPHGLPERFDPSHVPDPRLTKAQDHSQTQDHNADHQPGQALDQLIRAIRLGPVHLDHEPESKLRIPKPRADDDRPPIVPISIQINATLASLETLGHPGECGRLVTRLAELREIGARPGRGAVSVRLLLEPAPGRHPSAAVHGVDLTGFPELPELRHFTEGAEGVDAEGESGDRLTGRSLDWGRCDHRNFLTVVRLEEMGIGEHGRLPEHEGSDEGLGDRITRVREQGFPGRILLKEGTDPTVAILRKRGKPQVALLPDPGLEHRLETAEPRCAERIIWMTDLIINEMLDLRKLRQGRMACMKIFQPEVQPALSRPKDREQHVLEIGPALSLDLRLGRQDQRQGDDRCAEDRHRP